MLDARIRPLIDGPLDVTGRHLAARGVSADGITLAGLVCGLLAAVAIATGAPLLGLALLALNRGADGLDGAVARATAKTDRGGFLDIVSDFAFYAAVPLAFAVAAPERNALAAACLLAGFLINAAAFLAFALMAERRGLVSRAQGEKSLYYMAGLAEGTETIAVFTAMCLWPSAFPWLAAAFAVVCTASALARGVLGWRTLGDGPGPPTSGSPGAPR